MFVSCIQCVSVSYANEMNTDSEIVSVMVMNTNMLKLVLMVKTLQEFII